MKELAYLNGVFGPISDAKVSIEDRGFQFGDGVYEVIAVYNGVPFRLREHLKRLANSLAQVRIDFDLAKRPIEPIILDGLARSGVTDEALVYIQITRGAAPRAHAFPQSISPTVVMTFKPLPQVLAGVRERGIRAMTAPDIRWDRCFIKAITLLPNILAKNEALDRGYDDAIFVTDRGEVRECTSANIFIIRDGALYTPPRNESILHGVTLGFLLECAEAMNLKVHERPFNLDTMFHADELFQSSTMMEVLGIVSVDDQPIGDGRVGPITRRLFEEFRRRSREVTRPSGVQSLAG